MSMFEYLSKGQKLSLDLSQAFPESVSNLQLRLIIYAWRNNPETKNIQCKEMHEIWPALFYYVGFSPLLVAAKQKED